MGVPLCSECKGPDAIYPDGFGASLCHGCALAKLMKDSAFQGALILTQTVPFKVGDHVEASIAGQVLDGTGTVDKVSFDIANGGTLVHPMFHVVLADGRQRWYTENCLVKLETVS